MNNVSLGIEADHIQNRICSLIDDLISEIEFYEK